MRRLARHGDADTPFLDIDVGIHLTGGRSLQSEEVARDAVAAMHGLKACLVTTEKAAMDWMDVSKERTKSAAFRRCPLLADIGHYVTGCHAAAGQAAEWQLSTQSGN